jgi:predicted nucleotidyltransferase
MAEAKLSADDLSGLLGRLARGLEPIFGECYRGLVLYGSYARGEAEEGSDVDVLRVLDGDVAWWREYLKAGPLV